MAAELMGINVAQGGAVALLAVVVLMVLTGRLIPRRTYDDMKEERDSWRTAHVESEVARTEERDQNRQLLELAHTAGHVLDSLPKRGEVQPSDPMDEASMP
ncbi:hypothetical protein [Streptomyces angustmyceticus]|uniref:hypothetical protein n=1 Tax=Streptomyces angustmyceticus TaxID=285578 RepID=UPI00344B6890